MMNELIAQVLHLMQKQNERNYYKENTSNYAWICYKRNPTRLNSSDEVSIKLVAHKLSPEQIYNIIKQLKAWFEQQPNVEANEIPKMCVVLLNKEYNMSVIQNITNKKAENFQPFMNSVKNFTPFAIVTQWLSRWHKEREVVGSNSAHERNYYPKNITVSEW